MTANDGDDPATAETAFYGDQEAERASGVPLPSLRVLQAAGAIRSRKVAKEHGGYRRTWSEIDVLKASIAAALGEHFAWNIRIVAAVMGKVPSHLWEGLIETALTGLEDGRLEAPDGQLLQASEKDWVVQVLDRKFLFLKLPDFLTPIMPAWAQTDLFLGIVGKESFYPITWHLGNPEERKAFQQALGDEIVGKSWQAYQAAMAVRANFLSKATINLSLQVRATWRRLHGMESHFVQELVRVLQDIYK